MKLISVDANGPEVLGRKHTLKRSTLSLSACSMPSSMPVARCSSHWSTLHASDERFGVCQGLVVQCFCNSYYIMHKNICVISLVETMLRDIC